VRQAIITTSRPTVVLCNADVMKLSLLILAAFIAAQLTEAVHPDLHFDPSLVNFGNWTAGNWTENPLDSGDSDSSNKGSSASSAPSGWGVDNDFDPFQQATARHPLNACWAR
jgi:hypothetical protein